VLTSNGEKFMTKMKEGHMHALNSKKKLFFTRPKEVKGKAIHVTDRGGP
jgi:hypothetical protein